MLMIPLDTGLNRPEAFTTLWLQQLRLISGKRDVQMFPAGTPELMLPNGMRRVENARGVFHYNPRRINEDNVLTLSHYGRENEFLELGPYSKSDVLRHHQCGEVVTTITEYTPAGIEVRTAIGTASTLPKQIEYFEKTKEAGNKVVVGVPPERVKEQSNDN